jgi:hypothetical protein
MSVLKSLSFIAVQRASSVSPQQYRRNKLVNNLREQLAYVRADLRGETFTVMRRRWEMTEDGQKFQIDHEKRVKRWWEATEQGVAVQIRWANRPIEFEKGKTAILINTVADLPPLFEQLILAAANGEFDKFMADINKLRGTKKSKVA